MIITALFEIKKNKFKVETDEEVTLYLYKSDLLRFHLGINSEISEDVYQEITEELMPKRALDSCMRWFSLKDYTEEEIRGKLRKEGYDDSLVNAVIEKLYELRFLNDEYYARCYIENRMKRKSKREIIRELHMRGIDQEKAEQLFHEICEEMDENPEKEAIATILRKKHFDSECAEYEEREKMRQYLFRKGFNGDYVNELIRNNHLT